MRICDRCRSEEAVRSECDVDLCAGCAQAVGMGVGYVGQEGTVEGGAEQLGGHTYARSTGTQDAGKALEKTASAAGEIAKTVKVVAVIVAVGGVAWVGYALWKASRQANALQAEAKTALLAHPELLRI